ncbi:HAD-IA family hydrolase [Methylorubrum sp. B1-46]|uniref:HAD-IA family hydrolase n=1 Tax=Methylorubrum sp. B1-46 TaxID=2897334 RepID=UPI001E3E4AE9|nr:HAD-IA family hydrolase [Methylorubrum sp. B1-46]UGB27199.1 HAD-IA family hydrolase [Methylorubrum sp. B1-46]
MVRIGTIADFRNYAEPYRHVSFDLFDTLIRRRFLGVGEVHDTVSAYAQALIGRRHERPPSEITSLRYAMGRVLKGSVEQVIQEPTLEMVWGRILQHEDMVASDEQRQDLVGRIVAFEHALEMANLAPVEGAVELLTALKADGKVIIAISDMYFSHSQMLDILDKLGLRAFFDHIYISAHCNETKQTGDLFKRVLRDVGIGPQDMLHVGDNQQSDIVMAEKVGVGAVLVEQSHLIRVAPPAYGHRARVEEDVADVLKTYLFATMLDAYQQRSEHLYFMARDGCAMRGFLERWNSPLLSRFMPPPPATDLFLNRVLTCWSNVDLGASDWLVAAVGIAFWLKQGEATIAQLSALLGIETVPSELGTGVLRSVNDTFRVVEAYRNAGAVSAIRSSIISKRSQVLRYLKTVGFFDHRSVTFCDLGYSGSVLRALNTLLLQQITEGEAVPVPKMTLHLIVTYDNYEVNRVPALPFVRFGRDTVLPCERLPPGLKGSFAWLELFFKHPTLRPITRFIEGDEGPQPELLHDPAPPCATPAQRVEEFAVAKDEDIVLLWMAATGHYDVLATPLLTRFDEPDARTIEQMRDHLYELDPIEGTKRSIILEMPHASSDEVAQAARRGDYWISGSVVASALAATDDAGVEEPVNKAPQSTTSSPSGRARPRRGLLARFLRRWTRAAKPPSAPAASFDAYFYRSFYRDLRHFLTDQELWDHYQRHGRSERRLTSRDAFVTQLKANYGTPPDDFDTGAYLHYNPDLAMAIDSPERALEHYMHSGINEGRRYTPPLEPLNTEFEQLLAAGKITLTAQELARRQTGALTVELILRRHGIRPGPWIDRIDLTAFRAMHSTWCGPIATMAECIVAIVEKGLVHAPSLSFREPFDPAFYRAQLSTPVGPNTEDLFRHYLNIGSFGNLVPSEEAGLLQLWNRADYPEGLNWQAYRDNCGKRELRNADRLKVFRAFLDVPAKQQIEYLDTNKSTALVQFLALRSWHVHNRIDDARMLLSFAVRQHQDLGQIHHLLGDLEIAAGRSADALVHYRRGIAASCANRWSYINAARLLLDIGDHLSALIILQKGRAIWHEAQPWRGLYGRAMHLRSQACKERVKAWQLPSSGLAEADAIVREIATRVPMTSQAISEPGMVLLVSGRPAAGARQDRDLLANIIVCDLAGIDAGDYLAAILRAELVVFHEVPFTYEVLLAIATARALGREAIYWCGDLANWDGHSIDLALWGVSAEEGSWFTSSEAREMALVARYCDRIVTTLHGLRPVLCAIATQVAVEEIIVGSPNLRGTDRVARVLLIGPSDEDDDEIDEILARAITDAVEQDPALTIMAERKLVSQCRSPHLGGRIAPIDDRPTMAKLAQLVVTADLVVDRTSQSEAAYSLHQEAEARGIRAVMWRGNLTDCDGSAKASRPRDRRVTQVSGVSFAQTVESAFASERPRPKSLELAPSRLVRRPDSVGKPRLLFVNVWFTPQTFGGATRVLKDNIDYLLDHHADEFELAVFTSDEHNEVLGQFTMDSYRGIPVFRVATPEEPFVHWRPETSMVAARFEALLERFAPDLVHIHCLQRLSASVAGACAARGLPHLVTLHDGWWLSDNFFLSDEHGLPTPACQDYQVQARPEVIDLGRSALRAQRLRSILLGATRRLAVSSSFAATYGRCGIPCDVVENGVSRIPPVARSPRREDGRVALCHVGGLARHKGAFLIEAALRTRRYEHLHFTIVDLGQSEEFEEHLVWGGTPVTVVGRMNSDAIANFYARMDVLLAPSTCEESYGLVAREALVHGLWAVVGDRGGMAEAIAPDRNGFVVSVEDAEGVAAVLAEIDADPVRFRSSPSYVPPMRNADEQARELIALYRQLLLRQAGPRSETRHSKTGRAGSW